MHLHLESARRKLDKLQEQYGEDAVILNVTSKGTDPWARFSPFYPHGEIPVPFSPGRTAASVEGIWQGLNVSEGADVCEATLANTRIVRGRPRAGLFAGLPLGAGQQARIGQSDSAEKPSQSFRVRLWDQNDCIEQLLMHYDKLDNDLRAELPLKRIWAVAEVEGED